MEFIRPVSMSADLQGRQRQNGWFVLCLAARDGTIAFVSARFGRRILGAIFGAIGLQNLLFQKTDRGVVVFDICSRHAVQLLVLLDIESKTFLFVTRSLLAHDALFLPAILIDALAVIAQMGADSWQSLASRLLAKRTIQKNRVQQIPSVQRRRQFGGCVATRSRVAVLRRLAGQSSQRIIASRLLFRPTRWLAASALCGGGGRRGAACIGERTAWERTIEPTSLRWRRVEQTCDLPSFSYAGSGWSTNTKKENKIRSPARSCGFHSHYSKQHPSKSNHRCNHTSQKRKEKNGLQTWPRRSPFVDANEWWTKHLYHALKCSPILAGAEQRTLWNVVSNLWRAASCSSHQCVYVTHEYP